MTFNVKIVIKIASLVLVSSVLFLFSLAYIHYHDLRKTLAVTLSEKATSFIGQKVEIEDLSLSPTTGINLYNIRIKNPEGFAPGDLLTIKKIFLKMKYSRLAWGKFYFDEITVGAPALTLQMDAVGNMNISQKLQELFISKSTLKYQINEFTIRSGSFDFNQNRYIKSENFTLSLKDLSSEAGHKTMLLGDMPFAEGNRVGLDGWIYLKDEPKKLNITLSSGDLTFALLQPLLDRYGIDTKKTKAIFSLNADGDTDKGLQLKSTLEIKEAGFTFLKKDIRTILLDMQAFLNIPDKTLSFENISMQADGVPAATMRGEMKQKDDDLFYVASLRLDRVDLSEFNFLKGIQAGGLVKSDTMHMRGSLKKGFPEVTGDIQLADGSFSSDAAKINGINAQIRFQNQKEISLSAELTANVVNAYGYLFNRPTEVNLLLTANGNPRTIAFQSSGKIVSAGIRTKEGKTGSLEKLAVNIEGTIKDRIIEGNIHLEMAGIQYDTHRIPSLSIHSDVAYQENTIILRNQSIESHDFRITAGSLTMKKAGDAIKVTVEDLNGSYPAKKAGIRNTTLSLNMNTEKKTSPGTLSFSVGEAMFHGIHTGRILGNGQFNNKDFSCSIPAAQIANGKITLSLRGKTSGGPFPLTILSDSENIDISSLSKEALNNSEVPYALTGILKRAVFEGTVLSEESLQGNAEVQAEKVSLIRKDNRKFFQDASLTTRIDFSGEDVSFTVHAGAGKVSAGVSGKAYGLLKKDRQAEMQIHLPELKMTDIRETFWDIFPDNLLYAGLEGSVASDISLQYKAPAVTAGGEITLRNIVLEGENGEFSIGPVNGVVPVAYRKTLISSSDKTVKDGKKINSLDEVRLPSYDRASFGDLSKQYSQEFTGEGYSDLSVGSLSYGFRFLENIHVRIKQEGNVLNIGSFSGNIFGGRLNGSAVVSFADSLNYRAGLHIEGLSLTKLCESIEPIKGYISGKVNGVATLKGEGTGISALIGKAEFWSYSTAAEKTRISKEFLKKIGGPSLKAYLGDRSFDEGFMTLYLQKGFVIFSELEISNTNLIGMKDLSVKVAPFNNRIAIDHLMWTITEAAQRAKDKE
jgi:hypothetical protein